MATRDKLLDFGDQMSNLCFNLSQSDKVEPRNREIMRELCSNWDYFRRLLKAEEKPRKRRATKAKRRSQSVEQGAQRQPRSNT